MKIFKYSTLAVLFLVGACATNSSDEYGVIKDVNQADLINKKTAEQLQEVEVPDRVYFDFDKFTLTEASKKTLDLQVEFLKQDLNIKATIEGHCDERGTREYNLALGERRANSVKNYLVKKGISNKRIKVISFGKEKPEFVGKGETIWSKNRRSVMIVNQ